MGVNNIMPELVYIALDPNFSDQPARSGNPILRCESLEKALEFKTPLGYVIGTADPKQARQATDFLRTSPDKGILPIFFISKMPENLLDTVDGIADGLDDAYDKAAKIYKRICAIDQNIFAEPESANLRLLVFLYTRPNRQLMPVQDWSYPRLYQYPLVDSILGSKTGTLDTLNALVGRGLLRRSKLVDRIRLCPKCNFSHLNYVDICPECTNIDIVQTGFFHCFVCGTVAPEKEFIEKGSLTCPNCNTRLRHIGSDYDRALESYNCNHCDSKFEEPDVTTHCQNCRTKTPAQDLLPENIYGFEITHQGELSAKTGLMEDVLGILDNLDNLNPKVFETILDWQINLSRRHTNTVFGLVGLRFLNIPDLTDLLGRWQVVQLMDGLISRIQELLRDTDLTTRTTREIFWIFLPMSSKDGTQIVLERIHKACLDTRQNSGLGIEIQSVSCMPADVAESESGSILLARLSGELNPNA